MLVIQMFCICYANEYFGLESCQYSHSVVLSSFLPLVSFGSFPLWSVSSSGNVLFKFRVHDLLALKKRSSLLNPSFSQGGFIDFSAFPPDLIIVAIGVFLVAAVCVHKTLKEGFLK